MAKSTTSNYLAVWEQWLQKLSGSYSDEIRDDINRFEIIELLSQETDTDRQLCSRIGTIFNHFFPAEIIAIFDQSDDSLIYSSLPRAEEKKLISKVNQAAKGREVAQSRISLRLTSKHRPIFLRYLYLLQADSSTCHYHISFFTSKPLEPREIRFLEAVQALLNLRHHSDQSNRTLSTQNDRLKAVTQHLSEGLMILDRNLSVENWNRPMQHITGFSPREATSRPYKEVFRRSDSPDWLKTLATNQSPVDGRAVFGQEFQIATKSRHQIWVSVSGSFLFNDQNELEQTICIVRDVSKLKELEQRKNEFISIATHELRTPITAVKGYLSLIEKNREQLSEKHQNYLRQATLASDRLVKLAEDLLQVVHFEEEQLRFSIQPMLIYPVLKKVATDLRLKAEAKKLFLTLNEPSDKITILGDPVRIEQIFANLIENAIKYTNRGGVTVRRFSRTNRLTGECDVIVEVTDTGVGISGHDQETIFDKFRRTDSAHRSRESGAGLGLFIVKSFVEKQGGRINVRSRPHRGSTFRVVFPEADAKLARR
ncbi:MAG TPA: ATP-binding protein [Candidatus Saccharimonadales bacterium]|nr:ATP-binding protein [Candidatus Saccharimonadales bacterium]